MSKHGGVSAAAHDVMLVESLVKGDGLGEVLDGFRDGVFETAAPELGLFRGRGESVGVGGGSAGGLGSHPGGSEEGEGEGCCTAEREVLERQ